MDIGTAKPPPEIRAAIPHHFIDIRNPDEDYSAGAYGEEARAKIDEVFARGRQPIVVGGSGFYIRALVDGLYAPKIVDRSIRQRLQARADKEGAAALHAELQKIDPVSAERLHPNDAQRIVRALEVYEATGTPLSRIHQQFPPTCASFFPVFIGLLRERGKLDEAINRRTTEMVQKGLVEETRHLLEMGYGPHLNALKTVGYQEALAYLAGKLTFEEMVALIQKNTRHYAKRQLTWFRHDRRIRWISLRGEPTWDGVAEEVLRLFKAH